MSQIVLHFASAVSANSLVAGIPAAARAAHRVARVFGADEARCLIAVPGGWRPSAWCQAELGRLVSGMQYCIADSELIDHRPDLLWIRGEAFVDDTRTLAAAAAVRPAADVPADGTLAELRRAGRRIVTSTGKPGDGIVSRHLNRPVSQAMTRAVLRLPGVKPFHATLAVAGVAVVMAAGLFLGGPQGLFAGAVLFQVASILDGVDGEIARATFRTSSRGALLDSLTDAATNLAFVAGVTFNLWTQGHHVPAALGMSGLAMLATGLTLLGLRARARGGEFTFDALKDHFRTRPSRMRRWLISLTMRDFYAAAAAVLILLGLGPQLLFAFAGVTTIWLAVTLAVLARNPPAKQSHGGHAGVAGRPLVGDPRQEDIGLAPLATEPIGGLRRQARMTSRKRHQP